MSRFGLGYDDIKKHNPKVVYLSVTGFGQTGPNSKLPVTDSVIQAFSGWMTLHRDADGIPMRSGMIAVDVVRPLRLPGAVHGDHAPGPIRKGAYIDCSLMQAAAAFQSAKVTEYYLENGAPQVLYVPVGTMKTSDGYLNVTAMREHHYTGLCRVLGREDLANDPRYDSREKRIDREKELMPIVRAEFLKNTTDYWAKALTEAGVMNAKVNTYQDFMDDPHTKAVNALAWIEHQGMGKIPMANIPGQEPIEEGSYLAECPHTGQHTVEILKRNGYTDQQIRSCSPARPSAPSIRCCEPRSRRRIHGRAGDPGRPPLPRTAQLRQWRLCLRYPCPGHARPECGRDAAATNPARQGVGADPAYRRRDAVCGGGAARRGSSRRNRDQLSGHGLLRSGAGGFCQRRRA